MKLEDTDAVIAALFLKEEDRLPFQNEAVTAVKAIAHLGRIGIEQRNAEIRDLARTLAAELVDIRQHPGGVIRAHEIGIETISWAEHAAWKDAEERD